MTPPIPAVGSLWRERDTGRVVRVEASGRIAARGVWPTRYRLEEGEDTHIAWPIHLENFLAAFKPVAEEPSP